MKSPFMRRFGWPALVTLVVGAIMFYFTLPPINLMSTVFWNYAMTLLLVFGVLSLIFGTSLREVVEGVQESMSTRKIKLRLSPPAKVALLLFLACIVIMVVAEVIALPVFQAKRYAAQGNALVTEGDFASDVPVVENGEVTDIAIMDTQTAATMGRRQIGSLGTLATQYELGGFMTTTINGRVTKVAPLGYGDFWKWLNRRSEGIPGYVIVDPVTGASSYEALDQAMHYSDTGLLMDNVARKMRFAFPTAMLGNLHFEIDNDNDPYWVATVYTHKVSLFECAVPVGVVTCDAVTGECVRYDLADLPVWVSIAWPADDLIRLVNYAGQYSNGYFNSIMAKTGVYRTTNDYGYKVVGEDLNAFTGITSAASDQSNIGFILCDMHTGSIVLYNVYGAEEYSAEVAAEGLVMNYGYTASFPSLINVEGDPVYIMALTDDGDLIKKYAMVDLQDYTRVAVGDTVAETWQTFVDKYMGGGGSTAVEQTPLEGSQLILTLSAPPATAVVEGSSYAYLLDGTRIYRVAVDGNESILFAQTGSVVTLTVYSDLGNGVYAAQLDDMAQPAAPAETAPEPAQPEQPGDNVDAEAAVTPEEAAPAAPEIPETAETASPESAA